MDSRVPEGEMRMVVGVRLPKSARIYYFDSGDLALERGVRVWVTTEQGQVWGEVVIPPRLVPVADLPEPLQPVVRLWKPEDSEELDRIRVKEQEARAFCQERIEARGLPMRLVDVEWTFDGGRVTFYFVAEGRVDFRELVHDLAARYRCRVELRQIGVRDFARVLGGHGPCGRPLCCATFLRDFAPVGIRMAKEQNLSLNPGRISGMCGRLMCCLRYEDEGEGSSATKHDSNEVAAEEGSEAAEVAAAAEAAHSNGCCCLAGSAGRACNRIGGTGVSAPPGAGSQATSAATTRDDEGRQQGEVTSSAGTAGTGERESREIRSGDTGNRDQGGTSVPMTDSKRTRPGGERSRRTRGRRDDGPRKGSPPDADATATAPEPAAETTTPPQAQANGWRRRPGPHRDRQRRPPKHSRPRGPNQPGEGSLPSAEAG